MSTVTGCAPTTGVTALSTAIAPCCTYPSTPPATDTVQLSSPATWAPQELASKEQDVPEGTLCDSGGWAVEGDTDSSRCPRTRTLEPAARRRKSGWPGQSCCKDPTDGWHRDQGASPCPQAVCLFPVPPPPGWVCRYVSEEAFPMIPAPAPV